MTSAVRFVTPAWTNAKDVYDGIAEKVKAENVVGLQNYGSGRFEVLLSNAAWSEILLDEGFEINDRKIHVNIYKDSRKWIRVFGMPLLESDEDLRVVLAKYGEISKIRHETHEWNATLKTGVRRVLMTVSTDLPDIAVISGTKCRIQGPGVKKVCFDCLKHGHLKEKCPGIRNSTPDPEKPAQKKKEENLECSLLSSIHGDREQLEKKQKPKNINKKVEEAKNIDNSKGREERLNKAEEKKDKPKERMEKPNEEKEKLEERKKRRNYEETSGSNDENLLERMSDESTISFLDCLHGVKAGHSKPNKEQPWRKPSKKERRPAGRESFNYWSQGW